MNISLPLLLRFSRGGEDIPQAVVPLVACVLVYRLGDPRHRELHRPRLDPRERIVDGELVQQRVTIHQRKLLSERELLARAAKHHRAEVRRRDDEGVAVPICTRAAHPQADRLSDPRARVRAGRRDGRADQVGRRWYAVSAAFCAARPVFRSYLRASVLLNSPR
jgi:hypothetical protein